MNPPSVRRNRTFGLCLIIDDDSLRVPAEEALASALAAGVRFIQYRNKQGTRRQVFETACILARRCREQGAVFIVNDYADIARASEADGVHLGQDDLPLAAARRVLGPHRLIGISTHDRGQAEEAEAGGADYIGFGPVFPTATKDAGEPRGLGALRAVTSRIALPVIAIGGITAETAAAALAAGAAGVAVIGAVLSADDIESSARSLLARLRGFEERRS